MGAGEQIHRDQGKKKKHLTLQNCEKWPVAAYGGGCNGHLGRRLSVCSAHPASHIWEISLLH